MKKILIISVLIYSLALSFFVTYYYSKLSFYHMITSDSSTSVHIKDTPQLKDPNQFVGIITHAADECHLNISRQTYTLDDSLKKTTVTDYVYLNDADRFFENIPLQQGRYLTKEDAAETFLSSRYTSDAHQIGTIENFNSDDELKIVPFSNIATQTLSGDYILSTKDQTVINTFLNLLNDAGLEAKGNSWTYVSSPYMDFYLLMMSAVLYLILLCLTVVLFIYLIVFQFKELAIQKMFGMFNRSIVVKKLLKELLIAQTLGVMISFLITIICLYLFNHLSGFMPFVPIWLGTQLGSVLLLFIICYPFTFLSRFITPSTMLKGKKPVKLIRNINYCSKFLFSITAVVILSIIVNNVFLLNTQNQNIEKWQQVKNYASFWYAPDEHNSSNGRSNWVSEYFSEIKLQKFFELTNNDGGFMMSPSTYYTCKDCIPDYFPPFHPYKESVTVNNNYLQLNPIKDVNGNFINIPDEYTLDMTILVPEKYMNNKDEILDAYTNYHTQNYYSTQDSIKHKLGEDVGYDPSDAEEVIHHHDPLKVNIIFVQNNQKYFTYNPNCCTQNANNIVDPIAIVANNSNLSLDTYAPIISRGEYFGKVNDVQNPQESFKDAIIQSNAENNIIRVNMLYNQVDEYIYQTKNQLLFNTTMLFVIVLILLLIMIYSTSNYMEANKKINAVKKIHGFSFFKRHFAFLKYVPIFWGVIWISMLGIVKLMDLSETINLSILGIGSLSFMTIDLLVCYLTIRLKETQKAKDILKGE